MTLPFPRRRWNAVIVALGLVFGSLLFQSSAAAFWSPMNLCFECLGKMRLGTAVLWNADGGFDSSPHLPGVCECYIPPMFYHIGMTLHWWKPSHYIESTKTPWYFPMMDMYAPLGGWNFGASVGGAMGGAASGHGGVHDQDNFLNTHYVYYPVMAILNVFTDSFCNPMKGVNLDWLFVSEVDPLWQDEAASAFLFPETYLFANPFAALPCIADAAATNVGFPIESLFWCWGGHVIYPLTGNVRDERSVDAHFLAAGRMMYYQIRLLLHHDEALNPCVPVPSPLWFKNHYKYQQGMPVNRKSCFPAGKSSIWMPAANPPFAGTEGPADEFLWIIYMLQNCCWGTTI